MPAQGERYVLFDRQRVVQGCLLEQESNLLSDLVELILFELRDLLAGDSDGTCIWRLQPDNQLQQHALPASAPSQDGYGFTLSDLQVDAVQNPLLAEGLSQVPDLYRRLEPVFFHCFTTPRRSE